MRFQQLTGPLMAKGAEDTAFYVYSRLLSLNEVGGEPDRFGLSTKEFHSFNERRAAHWPHAMNASATHDTKRGEDARVRINVLSEVPAEWEKNLRSWSRINRSKKTTVRGAEAPDRNDEYFLYQTLIGSYPADKPHDSEFEERLTAYLIKAVREAKVHTEWLQPDTAYEKAFIDFARQMLARGESPFMNEFTPFATKIAYCGMFNSLAQVLLKITSPGVPDIYQGTEFWDLSFVDPDNRRPVDYAERRRCLEELRGPEAKNRAGLLRDLLSSWPDGRIKLYLMHKLLDFRRAHQELFAKGTYVPLEVLKREDYEAWKAFVAGGGAPDIVGFQKMVVDALEEIIAANAGRRVAVFCHGGVINVWTAHVLRMPPRLFFEPDYTSIHRFMCARSGQRNVVSLNERAHLRDTGLADVPSV